MWNGDYKFLLRNLILKDFRIRYRNMSLGVFWALLNPLVMMALFTIVFTKFFAAPAPNYPLFLLCGIVPFGFFTTAWNAGTTSILDNAGLLKRVPVPREVMPVASVLSVFVHALIQVGLLVVLALGYGKFPHAGWIWLPIIWGLLIIAAVGLAMLFSCINVYIRDTRYVVESANTVMFWVVPIFYPISMVPPNWRPIYLMNPLAAGIVAIRTVILDGGSPAPMVMAQLAGTAVVLFVMGWFTFRSLKAGFYNYL
jgi:ABC-type polysaccharide/polyol phosphate export permease